MENARFGTVILCAHLFVPAFVEGSEEEYGSESEENKASKEYEMRKKEGGIVDDK